MTSDEPVEGDVVLPYARPRVHQPFWVKVGLWGLSSRTSAWVFFWGCVLVGVVSAVLGFAVAHPWLTGTSMLIAAFWYWAAIRWVDRHGGWSQVRG
jgi:hypothetical protein